MNSLKLLPYAALAAVLAFRAPAAHASDGVVLINQATAVNGLPTCGSSGFPIVICQSGSYRLSGNLTVAAAGANGILIEAAHVTLDLGGFTLQGPGGASTATGILDQLGTAIDDITVENGSVIGFYHGISFSTPAHSAVLKGLVVEAGQQGALLVRGSVLDCHIYGVGIGLLFSGGAGLVVRNFLEAAGTDFAFSAPADVAFGENIIVGSSNGGTSQGTNVCGLASC